MTTRDEAFPSRYLKASDLRGPVTLEIKDAPSEVLTGFDGQQQTKTVLYFTNTRKKLQLNRTNFEAIVDVTGEIDSDNWVGRKIELFPSTTEVNGRMMACVRVRSPAVRPDSRPRPLAKTDAAAARNDAADDLADEIPW